MNWGKGWEVGIRKSIWKHQRTLELADRMGELAQRNHDLRIQHRKDFAEEIIADMDAHMRHGEGGYYDIESRVRTLAEQSPAKQEGK